MLIVQLFANLLRTFGGRSYLQLCVHTILLRHSYPLLNVKQFVSMARGKIHLSTYETFIVNTGPGHLLSPEPQALGHIAHLTMTPHADICMHIEEPKGTGITAQVTYTITRDRPQP